MKEDFLAINNKLAELFLHVEARNFFFISLEFKLIYWPEDVLKPSTSQDVLSNTTAHAFGHLAATIKANHQDSFEIVLLCPGASLSRRREILK